MQKAFFTSSEEVKSNLLIVQFTKQVGEFKGAAAPQDLSQRQQAVLILKSESVLCTT